MSNKTQVSRGQLTPQHSKLKPVNWQIYLLVWASVSQKLNLPPPKELYRPMVFKHWRCFSDHNYTRQAVCLGYRGCSFLCRSVRITGLLSTSLVLRIGDWLCVLPAITLVVWQVQESEQSCLLGLTGGEPLNPQDRRLKYCSLPSWQGWEALYTEYIVLSEMSNSTLYAVLCKSHKHHLRHT